MEAADGDQGMKGGGVLRGLLKRRDDPVAAETPDLPPTPPMTPARAATAAIGRTAEQLYSLPIRPVAVVPGALTLAELPELLPEMSLLAVLQGPGDQLGAIALSPEVAAALVEVQALGRVTSRPLERRKPTRSDAALCADFIEGLLSEMATEMRAIPGYSGFAGYHFLTHLEDARPLALMLEDIAYRSIDMQLRLGGADAREGRIMLILPQGPEVAAPAPMAARSAAKPAAPRPSLAPRMQDAPVELQGILCRRTMSLGELRGVLGGKLLYLPRVALQDAQLETSDGQILARGKLGEAEGCHALRLLDPAAARPAPDAGTPLRPAPAPVDLARPDPFRPDQGVGLQAGPGRETA
ncbi:FliM/FliN family flagellar motor switch protein [Paracoccus sp. 1_MG-2023]|uniref:FliM/FliN family flagellar motor switch protein n=1 Tax=unclassified Paracoccus (in: a-proteobacteria) TaxID=2688777 RepID=UPI001C0A27D5|nr:MULTISPECIES: FliM/FliN family flagellar motor switch protein [unclassified Paracoccus (in: a-proteobacteria)]MBU2958483.1 FliM/FliN family flagellar motor switch protein [Paracoccus sp. C2R09]MDO6668532.1 FliM/FliN family flagellar motor switch protein [Paracoccus sp. 1_MG-2023]